MPESKSDNHVKFIVPREVISELSNPEIRLAAPHEKSRLLDKRFDKYPATVAWINNTDDYEERSTRHFAAVLFASGVDDYLTAEQEDRYYVVSSPKWGVPIRLAHTIRHGAIHVESFSRELTYPRTVSSEDGMSESLADAIVAEIGGKKVKIGLDHD